MTTEQLIARLRRECELAGSQFNWASVHGISVAYLSDVLSGRREPGRKLLDAMAVDRVVSYHPRPSPTQRQYNAAMAEIERHFPGRSDL